MAKKAQRRRWLTRDYYGYDVHEQVSEPVLVPTGLFPTGCAGSWEPSRFRKLQFPNPISLRVGECREIDSITIKLKEKK